MNRFEKFVSRKTIIIVLVVCVCLSSLSACQGATKKLSVSRLSEIQIYLDGASEEQPIRTQQEISVYLSGLPKEEVSNYETLVWTKAVDKDEDWLATTEDFQTLDRSMEYEYQYLLDTLSFEQPETVAIQVDVKDVRSEEIKSFWLGEYLVADFVFNDIRYAPYRLTFDMNEEIKLKAALPYNAINQLTDYEFTLLAKNDETSEDWLTISDYQDFPTIVPSELPIESIASDLSQTLIHIANYQFEQPGIHSLHIDIRHKDSGEKHSYWVGQFFINDLDSEKLRSNIIQLLLPAYHTIDDFESLYDFMSTDLSIISALLYKQWAPEEFNVAEHLLYLLEPNSFSYVGNEITVTSAQTKLSSVNLEEYVINYGPQYQINLDLAVYPDVQKIFQALPLQEFSFFQAAYINHSLYGHYNYGNTNPSSLPYDLRVPVSSCGYLARDLLLLLKPLGYPVVWKDIVFDNQAVHAVCEVSFGKQIYTFDPTTNAVFNSPPEKIGNESTETYIFPQRRNMNFYIEKEYWRNIASVSIVLEAN